MKKQLVILSILMCVWAVDLMAQTYRHNTKEIGLLLAQTSQSGRGEWGIQYKRHRSANKLWRFQLLMARSQTHSDVFNVQVKDSALWQTRRIQTDKGLFIGLGKEWQRQMWNRLYAYAVIDIQLGMGKTTTYDYIEQKKILPNGDVYQIISTSQRPQPNIYVQHIDWRVLPAIGFKLLLTRLVLSTEIGPSIDQQYVKQYHPLQQSSLYNLDIQLWQTKLGIGYRF